MKNILAFLVLPVFAAGCAGVRWEIHDLQCSCGADREHPTTYHQPLLMDQRTGRSWAFRWDNQQQFFWQAVSSTNTLNGAK